MSTLHGYIRTSRRLVDGEPGNDPDTQRLQLLDAGVEASNVYQDLGISGSTGTNTRQGWRSLNSDLNRGDVLVVVSVDRVGRGWIDVMGVIRIFGIGASASGPLPAPSRLGPAIWTPTSNPPRP